MCAVIGAVIRNPTEADFDLLHRVFLESSIRGLHATGASWIWRNEIATAITPNHAYEWLNRYFGALKQGVDNDGNLYLVGHCRYSTSDLQYNQPIYTDRISVVHNGVITQEMPEKWEDLYGYKCETKNDSELILRTIESGKSPLEIFTNSSMAVGELYLNGGPEPYWNQRQVRFYRNGKRPLYYSVIPNGYIITSTEDIAQRCFLTNINELPMNTYMSINSDFVLNFVAVPTNNIDLQHA
jgi:asparagine synthetase B (glutamine-hydrolysing)